MKISELENLIFKNASKINITRSRKILDENNFIGLSVHKVNNNYNIYGEIKSDNSKKYQTHLRIDIKNDRITFTKCSCHIFNEVNSENTIYMCEHLLGTGIKFVEDIKRKLNSKRKDKETFRLDKSIVDSIEKVYISQYNEDTDYYVDKQRLEINISLKEVKEEKIKAFDISIFIGNGQMYPIQDIRECISTIINKKEYCIGKGIVYNNKKFYFTKEDQEVLNYIYEIILLSNNSECKSAIRIPSEILRRFLETLKNKKIKFNYNYQSYISSVISEDLPLSFTMKKLYDTYVLTTKKVFPIPLNNKMDIFFYDRNIYIPSNNQLDIYRILYKYLKDDKKITFKEDVINDKFNILNKAITSISKNIFYDEAIIEKMNEGISVAFNFNKKKGKSICDISLKSSTGEISYSDALKINNNSKPSRKLIDIERILNKNRFYFRNDTFEFLGNEEDYYNFLKEGIDEINVIGKIFIETKYKDEFKLHNGKFDNISIKANNKGTYDVCMQLENITGSELKDAENAYRQGKSYIRLDDGIYIALKSKEFEKVMKIINSLNLNISQGKDRYELPINKLYYLKDKFDQNHIPINNKLKLTEFFKTIEGKEDKVYESPKELKCELRGYQIEGYNWFKNLSSLGLGGILSDEMGLGKTIQTIAYLLSEKSRISMIIVPTSLLYNWKSEIEKFAPSLKVGIIHGEKKERIKILENYLEYDVLLSTYGTLKNDFEDYESIVFDNIILDEGQNIKNHKSQITKMVKMLKGKNKFVLTGTPIENNLNELWSLFDFIMPGYLYTNSEFNEKFVKDISNVDELKVLINPYILRRVKKDVIDELPEKFENKIYVELPIEQKNIYDAFVKEVKNNISNENINNITMFSYLTKLRQLCLDPSIVSDEYKGTSGKIEEALHIIKGNSKSNKILLFSQFTSTLKKLRKVLEDEEIQFCYLDGSISSINRIKIVEEFNSNENKRVFLISLKAGGTGLNLTSANMVIHFDPWWNPSIEDQATDRAHRIGQKRNVEVIKLIAKDTIEEKIVLLQEDKKELINDVLSSELNDNKILSKINSKELIELLK